MSTKKKAVKKEASGVHTLANNVYYIGFHITKDNGNLRGGGRQSPGETHVVSGRVQMCKRGLHASPTLEKAAQYRFAKEGRYVSLVRVHGNLEFDESKVVGSHRKVLAQIKIDRLPDLKKQRVFTGVGVVEITSLPKSWFEEMENKLWLQYAANRKQIEAMDRVVERDS